VKVGFQYLATRSTGGKDPYPNNGGQDNGAKKELPATWPPTFHSTTPCSHFGSVKLPKLAATPPRPRTGAFRFIRIIRIIRFKKAVEGVGGLNEI
jgi:hypothetical protein